ncbi:MAG TPA: FtsK/SpoIIIE domain-containing protein [Cellulomonas sp.]
MRLTVVSRGVATDVEVEDGVPLARLRRWLTRLTGDASWTAGTPTADGVPLPDTHPCGVHPLVQGATLRPGPGPLPDAVRAARASAHLAVVAGPDTGALHVPAGRATLGPGAELAVADDAPWSLVVRPGGRRRPHRARRRPKEPAGRCGRPRAPVLLIRRASTVPLPWRPSTSTTSATAARLVGPTGRSRRVPQLRWARWRPGEELRAGASVVVLRADDAPQPRATAGDRSSVRGRLTRLTRFLPAAAGAGTSIALAVSLRQPVLLLGALSALVLVVAPAGAVSAAPTEAEPAPDAVDLAALRVALAAPAAAPAGRVADSGHGPDARDVRAAEGAARAPTARGALRWRHPVPWHGDLTVAGPRPAALAAARGLLLAALADDDRAEVAVHTDRPEDWGWLAWSRRSGGMPTITVLDGAPAAPTPGASERVLRVIVGPPPTWSRAVLAVDGRTARLRGADGRSRDVPLLGVTAVVAEAALRAVSGRPRAAPGLEGCPADVALGDLPGVPPPHARAVARQWQRAAPRSSSTRPRLATPIGAGPGGRPVWVDLVRDGPHALVAGTTGSGKSELLTSLVLGLALAHPPGRLAVLLVDFKGGTGLPALAGLPHVVGHLSDLDAAGARRTLRGLSAELRRRERVLSAQGARDLRDLDPLDPVTPPRLLVVVDEFRVLADELPDLLPGLARIAALGRSLGVHLVLATQRPAGAVPADLRANVSLRVVLRVADPADSSDLVGVPDAAALTRPGQAVLARGGGRPEPLQVARAEARRSRPVRLARPWPGDQGSGGDRGGGEQAGSPRAGNGQAGSPRAGAVRAGRVGWTPLIADRGPAAWVDAIREAASGHPRPAEPWLPPLPDAVVATDVPPGPGMPLALADLPDELSRGAVRWDPDAGHLLVLGGPGSGRTATLVAVASAALAQDRPVHAVGVPSRRLPPGVASTLEADDATRVARLVRLLSDTLPGDEARPLLLVDDVAAVLAALAAVARGAAADRLDQLWATAGGPVAVVASGGVGPAAARLAPFFADRLVLGSPDPAGDLLAGVPAELAGPRPQPGRAVHVGRHGSVLCQVALPAPTGQAGSGGPTAPGRAGRLSEPAGVVGSPGPPGLVEPLGPARHVRVLPLPSRVAPAALPAPVAASGSGGRFVAIGLGGDDAGPVSVDLSRPLLVVGPPGSGRTAALEALAGGASAAGLHVVRVGSAGASAVPDDASLLVADDLDELEARDPPTIDALAALLATGTPCRLVAATTTAHAVSAYRGPVPLLVRARRLLVLDLAEPGTLDLLGPEGAWLTDTRRRPPGRGALRLGRDVVPVQVVAPAPGRRAG